MFSKTALKQLRNDIPITVLIGDVLEIPSKMVDGYFKFLCPICSEFTTATNLKTNLARCFRCQKNFNTIDLTMLIKKYTFKETVEYLQDIRQIILERRNQISLIMSQKVEDRAASSPSWLSKS